jgi:hypothetical protein
LQAKLRDLHRTNTAGFEEFKKLANYRLAFFRLYKINMRLILLLTVIVTLNAFGQDSLQNQSKVAFKPDVSRATLYADWLIYATNNSYTKGLIQQKCDVDSQINVLQKNRQQFIEEDHYNTYTNTPYLFVDDSGHSRAYSSRAAYDDDQIGGLIKSSLNINQEIIKQKELYFASRESNVDAVKDATLSPPSGFKFISE